jgi:hypothetical protein
MTITSAFRVNLPALLRFSQQDPHTRRFSGVPHRKKSPGDESDKHFLRPHSQVHHAKCNLRSCPNHGSSSAASHRSPSTGFCSTETSVRHAHCLVPIVIISNHFHPIRQNRQKPQKASKGCMSPETGSTTPNAISGPSVRRHGIPASCSRWAAIWHRSGTRFCAMWSAKLPRHSLVPHSNPRRGRTYYWYSTKFHHI